MLSWLLEYIHTHVYRPLKYWSDSCLEHFVLGLSSIIHLFLQCQRDRLELTAVFWYYRAVSLLTRVPAVRRAKTTKPCKKPAPAAFPSLNFNFRPCCTDAFFPILLAENIKPAMFFQGHVKSSAFISIFRNTTEPRAEGLRVFWRACVCAEGIQVLPFSALPSTALASSLVQSVRGAFSNPTGTALCPTHWNLYFPSRACVLSACFLRKWLSLCCAL